MYKYMNIHIYISATCGCIGISKHMQTYVCICFSFLLLFTPFASLPSPALTPSSSFSRLAGSPHLLLPSLPLASLPCQSSLYRARVIHPTVCSTPSLKRFRLWAVCPGPSRGGSAQAPSPAAAIPNYALSVHSTERVRPTRSP